MYTPFTLHITTIYWYERLWRVMTMMVEEGRAFITSSASIISYYHSSASPFTVFHSFFISFSSLGVLAGRQPNQIFYEHFREYRTLHHDTTMTWQCSVCIEPCENGIFGSYKPWLRTITIGISSQNVGYKLNKSVYNIIRVRIP